MKDPLRVMIANYKHQENILNTAKLMLSDVIAEQRGLIHYEQARGHFSDAHCSSCTQ